MKEFGYPEFDANGEMILCEYTGDYAHMLMDVRVYKMKKGDKKSFKKEGEEIAALLMSGEATISIDEGKEVHGKRKDVFTIESYAAHVCTGHEITVECFEDDTEVLIQCTKNDKTFEGKVYSPGTEHVGVHYTGLGEMDDCQVRQVNTIFGKESEPNSNMVLGEILNNPGCWSGYPPHNHPQPELYYFKMDSPLGFGASFLDDDVYKIVDNSFSAIPGGKMHPQAAAPGFKLWTCWMIRHLDDDPWLETSRFEDKRYSYLHDMKN